MAILRWSTALAIALLLVLVGGEALSSVALRGAPLSVPQVAQKSSGDRSIAPMSESAGAASQTAPRVPATATEDLRQADRPDEAARSVPSAPATPIPGAGVLDSGTMAGAKDAERSSATPQPTAVAPQLQQGQHPAAGLPILRIVEIGLVALILALAAAGFLARRAGR